MNVRPAPSSRRKVKPKSNAQMKKVCDDLYSKTLRIERGRCQWRVAKSCSDTVNLQAAHFIRRNYDAVRFDDRNVFVLCASCHVYAHNFELQFEAWVEEQIGLRAVIELKHRALMYARGSYRADYFELHAQIQERHKRALAQR